MSRNPPKRHHYVPQFYLRRFASPDDRNKVPVLEQHRDVLVADRKSIARIGYEEGLHDYILAGAPASIETAINHLIETPFSKGATWLKIIEGRFEALNASDARSLYMFARHLQRRNVETLRFIEVEHARVRAEGSPADLDEEERAMHAWIAASVDGAGVLFRRGAMDMVPPADADRVNIMVHRSPLPLRTSTNPTLVISQPGSPSVFGAFFGSLRTWWLTLDRHCGAFIVAGGPPGFSNSVLPVDVARVINRHYLVQHQNSRTVRYLIADDEHLPGDLDWAGYHLATRTIRGARYVRKTGPG